MSAEPSIKKHAETYEIRVEGHLDQRRVSDFNNLTVTHHLNGETALAGPIPDQAALYGLLNWLRDLGISLVSVNRLGPDL